MGLFDDFIGVAKEFKSFSDDIKSGVTNLKDDVVSSVTDIKTDVKDSVDDIKKSVTDVKNTVNLKDSSSRPSAPSTPPSSDDNLPQ